MRFAVCTAILAVLAVFVGFAVSRPLAIPCTNTPCTGPVDVTFFGSDDCNPQWSYKISAQTHFRAGWLPNTCYTRNPNLADPRAQFQAQHMEKASAVTAAALPADSTYYIMKQFNPPGFYVNNWNAATCTGYPNLITFRNTGLCTNTTTNAGRSSSMTLQSINAPLPDNRSLPTPLPYPTIDLHSVIKCEPGTPCGFAWDTSYVDANCQKPYGKSYSLPHLTKTGVPIKLNECYSLPDAKGIPAYNLEYKCLAGLRTEFIFQGAGCNSTVVRSSSRPINVCLPDNYGGYVKYFCKLD